MIDLVKRCIGSPRFRPGSLKACLVVLPIVAGATALHVAFEPFLAAMPFVTLFPAVIAASFLCGSLAGYLAIPLSLVAASLFILTHNPTDLSAFQSAMFTVGAATIVSVIGLMRAATAEIRRVNETLMVSERRFRGLLESAPDAMVIVDAGQRITLVNAEAEELFGHRRSALIGQPIAVLLTERARDGYKAQLAASLSRGAEAPRRQAIDVLGARKDGTSFPIEISLAPLESEGGRLIVNAIRDTTTRRQMEARVIEASKAKSRFLAGMSHELRTPLNAIIGFSEMIRDAVIGPLDPRYRGYGGDISASGRHLQKIINDILDISKVESGRLELREEIVSVAEMVDACRRIVAAMAEAAGVSLILAVPPGLPPIRSDELRFQQILLNLVSNAVKFTPSGGRVRVSAAATADGLVIIVEDSGIGMRPEDIPIALEPFRQIDGIMSRRFDGTGLGLPLAKALIELHGGRLEIASAPGLGTTVRVCLPAERISQAA